MKLHNPTNSDIKGFWQRFDLPAGGTLELRDSFAKEMLRTFRFLEVVEEDVISAVPLPSAQEEIVVQEEPAPIKRGRKKTK